MVKCDQKVVEFLIAVQNHLSRPHVAVIVVLPHGIYTLFLIVKIGHSCRRKIRWYNQDLVVWPCALGRNKC